MLPPFPPDIRALPRPLSWVRDLEEFEGPILSELRAEDGGVYLEKWCAKDGELVRTLIVRTEPRAVAEYLAGRISLLSLLTVPSDGIGFIVDRSGDSTASVYLVHVPTLPSNYLPSSTARHDAMLRPQWNNAPQSFLVDGEWDAKLLATIERKYLDVFAFTYFAHSESQMTALPQNVITYDYDGGYPYMHAFSQLRLAVPKPLRAHAVGVSVNSPGVLTIDASHEIAERVSAALASLPNSLVAYRALHEWAKLKPKHVTKMPETDVAIADIRRLCQQLQIELHKVLPRPADGAPWERLHVLAAGKLVASYWRKLLALLEPAEGVEFLTHDVAVSELTEFEEDDDEQEYDYVT